MKEAGIRIPAQDGKLAVLGLTQTADVSRDGHIVRRVCEDHLRALLPQKLAIGSWVQMHRRKSGDPSAAVAEDENETGLPPYQSDPAR